MANITLGFELMIVGMTTVFVILLIVILGGKLLIKVVNYIAPTSVDTPKSSPHSAATANIDNTTMEVLRQTVAQLTGGKGHLTSAKQL